jgi:hypothetical protein
VSPPSLSDPIPDDEQDQLGSISGGIPRLDLTVSPAAGSLVARLVAAPRDLEESNCARLGFGVLGKWLGGTDALSVMDASSEGRVRGALSVVGALSEGTVMGAIPVAPEVPAADETADSALIPGPPTEPRVDGVERRS